MMSGYLFLVRIYLKKFEPDGFCQINSTPNRRAEPQQNQIMLQILEEILENYNVANVDWFTPEKRDYTQVTFPIETRQMYEKILYQLKRNNIGKLNGSSIIVLPCSELCNGYLDHVRESPNKSEFITSTQSEDENEETWKDFVSTKTTQLTVAQIVETVKNKAVLTFDFICLLLISTTMCALGLVENSTVYLLSSMVMSPMMGPVMAATFGSVIRDKHLMKIGVKNELLGLGIATLVGFCYGAITCTITDSYGTQNVWPTYEITSRGELRSLWIGCIIALLSGAAVVLGILSDNIASLVGVAISTSLMPPAVNAGLVWSMAAVYYVKGNFATRFASLNYPRNFSDNDVYELVTLGAISICLTFVNIICIYFAAIFIFKVKEVAPIASRDEERRKFWKHDIKNARYNNTIQREEGRTMRDRMKKVEFLHHSVDLPPTKSMSKEDQNSKIPNRNESTWSYSSNHRKERSPFKIFYNDEEIHQNKVRGTGMRHDIFGAKESASSNTKFVITKTKTFVVTTFKDNNRESF